MADIGVVREERCDVAVLGGGVAGLVAAWKASANDEVVLLEAEDRIGGRVESVQRGKYWVNLGAQFTEGEGVLIDAMAQTKIERASLAGKTSALAWRGRVVASHAPEHFVLRSRLSLPARVDLARFGLRMLRGYRRLLENKKRSDALEYRARLDSQPSTVLLDSVRTDDVREIFRGMVQTWIGCEPEETAATQVLISLGSAFSKAAELPNFSYPFGGNQAFTDTLAGDLGDRVRLGSTVQAVSWGDNEVEISYVDALGTARLTARRCIVALPADRAAAVLRDLDDSQREALASVRYGRFVVAGMFTKEDGRPQPWDDMYSISTPGLSFQVIFNHAAALRQGPPRMPGGALVCYSGGDRAVEHWNATDEEIGELFSRDLGTVFPGLNNMVEEVVIKRQERSVPFWGPDDRPHMRLLKKPIGPIALAGDYLGIAPSMAAAAWSGDRAVRSL